MKIKLSKKQWEYIGKKAGWTDEQPDVPEIVGEPSTKKLVKRLSTYNPEELQYLEERHLLLGEKIFPHSLIDQAESVEIWKDVKTDHSAVNTYTLTFLSQGKQVGEITVNQL